MYLRLHSRIKSEISFYFKVTKIFECLLQQNRRVGGMIEALNEWMETVIKVVDKKFVKKIF